MNVVITEEEAITVNSQVVTDPKDLVEKPNTKQNQLKKALGTCQAWNLQKFFNLYKKGRLKVDEYQRKYQDRKTGWNSRLVDSVLCNITIGEIMVEKKEFDDGNFCYYIIDGQHRIMTLMKYMDDDIKIQGRYMSLTENQNAKKYSGSYTNLPATEQDNMENARINVYEFAKGNGWTAADIFLRLNDGTTGLKPMQKYHSRNYLRTNYRTLYDFAHKSQWKDYCNEGYSVNMDHLTNIQALFKHLQYYYQYINNNSNFKNGQEFKFDTNTLSTLSEKDLKNMLDETRQYLDLYAAVAGHGIEILSGNDPRKTIFITIILSHLLANHNISNLSMQSQVIAKWINDFVQKEPQINTSLIAVKIAGRGDSIDTSSYLAMIDTAYEELENHLYSNGMPQVNAPISKKQRQELRETHMDSEGMITCSISGTTVHPRLIDFDHIVRRVDGGSNDNSNLRPILRSLNRSQSTE